MVLHPGLVPGHGAGHGPKEARRMLKDLEHLSYGGRLKELSLGRPYSDLPVPKRHLKERWEWTLSCSVVTGQRGSVLN